MDVKASTSEALLTPKETDESDIGREQFLRLFLAQLSNQDPLNPVDDKEFVAQLAQFSQLEQTMETNRRLALLEAAQSSLVSSQTTQLIGKTVKADQDNLTLADGAAPDLNFRLHGNASIVNLQLEDANGRTVRSIPLGALNAGDHQIAWDGLGVSGLPLPDGQYSLRVAAVNGEELVEHTVYVEGKVTGVNFSQGFPSLVVEGNQNVRPADVVEVRADTQSATGGG